MKILPMLVAIHGVPRSGTSWLGELFNSSPQVAYRFQPLFSYAFKDRIDERSSAEEIESFLSELLITEDDFVLQRGDKRLSERGCNFTKKGPITHLVYKEVRYHHILQNLLSKLHDVRIIGIVRHPCAVINSWLQAPKEFNRTWKAYEEWRFASKKNQSRKEEFNGFEKWKEATLMFLDLSQRYRDRFYLLKYSHLNANPLDTIRAVFRFCNLAFDQHTLDFIKESTSTDSRDPYGVFRNAHRDDKWKFELDRGIRDAIMYEIGKTVLREFLD